MNNYHQKILAFQDRILQLKRLLSLGLIDDKKYLELEDKLIIELGLKSNTCHRKNKLLNELINKNYDGNITPDLEVVK